MKMLRHTGEISASVRDGHGCSELTYSTATVKIANAERETVNNVKIA